ncbi:MAG TPA: ABC transporter substrate-binding protein [Gammaproteobacteria bacterium]|nr:ABC transporter substrate-binding protein [Gammaproteobacteria bacterium]
MSKITVARQYGVSYLPLMVMQQHHLIEKHAKEEGIDGLKVQWVKFAGGNVMNDALLSGSLQFASGGVGPLVKIWAKTHGNLNVKGVSALNAMPLYLNTRNPNIHSLKDFTSKDKIALPAVKVSIQAVTLQMAAAQEFGEKNYDKLDKYTVSMSHPDGMQAMLSGMSEVDAHFTSPPYQYKELQDPKVHTVLTSFQVLGGPATFNVVWTTSKFHDNNPKLYKAFTGALSEAIDWIHNNQRDAAKLYLKAAHSKDPVDFIYKIITDPKVSYTMTPKHTTKYSDFLYKVGAIKVKPESWKDMFFSNVHDLPGS